MWKTIFFLTVGSVSAHAGITRLEAISMIETGNNDWVVGKAGEVSRYQIKPRIWRQYSRSRGYTDPRVSRWVAEQHLDNLEKYFRASTGREPTDFDCYVMWNGGLSLYSHAHFSPAAVKPVIRERARRYANLVKKGETPNSYAGNVGLRPRRVGQSQS